jgi:hypothetical protein
MEAICSSETSVGFQRATLRYIPEDRTVPEHRITASQRYPRLVTNLPELSHTKKDQSPNLRRISQSSNLYWRPAKGFN